MKPAPKTMKCGRCAARRPTVQMAPVETPRGKFYWCLSCRNYVLAFHGRTLRTTSER